MHRVRGAGDRRRHRHLVCYCLYCVLLSVTVCYCVAQAIGVDIVILASYEGSPSEPYLTKNWKGDDVLIVPPRGQKLGTSVDNVTATFSDVGPRPHTWCTPTPCTSH